MYRRALLMYIYTSARACAGACVSVLVLVLSYLRTPLPVLLIWWMWTQNTPACSPLHVVAAQFMHIFMNFLRATESCIHCYLMHFNVNRTWFFGYHQYTVERCRGLPFHLIRNIVLAFFIAQQPLFQETQQKKCPLNIFIWSRLIQREIDSNYLTDIFYDLVVYFFVFPLIP